MSWQEAHRPSAWGRFRVLGLPEHLILFTFTLSFSEGCQPGLCPHRVSLHRQRLPYQGSSHLGTVLHQEVWHPQPLPAAEHSRRMSRVRGACLWGGVLVMSWMRRGSGWCPEGESMQSVAFAKTIFHSSRNDTAF